ncbi:MAG: hypothetical protein AAFN92_13710 [Bacteroidota bacterium]
MSVRHLSKRLVPTLTAYLLLVSIGLPLQRIYCACVGEQWISLTTVEHECHHAPEPIAQDHKTGCCAHGHEHEQSTASDRHDCGDSEVLLAQLDADFLGEKEQLLWLEPLEATLLVAVRPWPTKPVVSKDTPIRGPDPPPLPAGRALLVAHQTFLI